MNKKISYIFGLLVLGLFVISACQQDTVGGRIGNRGIVDGGENIGARQQVDIGDDGDESLGTVVNCRCNDDGDFCKGKLSKGEVIVSADCSCCESKNAE